MPDKKFTFTITLNEYQLDTLQLMAKYANFHMADLLLRKDGQEHRFQADWLREVLQQVKKLRSFRKGDKVRHKHTGKMGVVAKTSLGEVDCLVTIDGGEVKMLTTNLELVEETLIRINMTHVIITKPEITYRDIVDIAYGKDCQLLMTVAWQSGDRMSGGCLAPNDPPIPVTPGMVISAYHTGNA